VHLGSAMGEPFSSKLVQFEQVQPILTQAAAAKRKQPWMTFRSSVNTLIGDKWGKT